jgi:hypothetical protein
MLMDTVTLPKKDKDVVRVLENHVRREEERMTARRTRWLLAYLYTQGYRSFSFYDESRARVGTMRLKQDGTFPLQTSDYVAALNRAQAYLGSMDFSPLVRRQGNSLSSIRQKAMAQVVADAIVDQDELDRLQPMLCHVLAQYGSAGLQGKTVTVPTIGLHAQMEVVNPQEVFPFPSEGWDYTKCTGRIRSRLVSMDALKKAYGKGLDSAKEQMLTFDRQVGEPVDDLESPIYSDTAIRTGTTAPSGAADSYDYTLVKVRELYIVGERNRLIEYIAFSGEKLLQRERFDEVEAYCPLGWARYIDGGSFYGLGMFDMLFSILREKERLIEDMIQNTKDMERYPVTVLPHGVVNERVAFEEKGRKMRYMMVRPEASYDGTPPIRPITISPHNVGGDLPGRTAAFLQEMVEQVNPLRDIIKEKGRVDSFSGLQFLSEQDEKSVSHPVAQLNRMFGDVYRYATAAGIRMMMETQQKIPLSRLDLGLLGAVVDWEQGTVSLSKNVIPDLSRLSFGVRSTPKSEVLMKAEAISFLEKGFIQWDRFVRFCLKRGLDYAVDLDVERAAHRTCVQQLLTLFNDGQYPGDMFLTPHTELPEYQLPLVNEVLMGPEIKAASPEVIDALMTYREQLMSMVGAMLPAQAPDPFMAQAQQAPPQGLRIA